MPKVKEDTKASSSMKAGARVVAAARNSAKSVSSSTARSSSKAASGSKTQDPEFDKTSSDLQVIALDTLEKDTMDPSWFQPLSAEFDKPYFLKLKEFLRTEYQAHSVFPSINNVYSWSRLTPFQDVRVVVLGQDPYHDVGQAHGLSFSVLPPTKVPGSLRNIYKQMASDVPGFVVPKTGDLTPLAQAGVLWLNACLTVRAHKANSHSKKGWEKFTTQVLKTLVHAREAENKGLVFMAWGLPAQKTCAEIGINPEKHLLLKSAHPSPLSAHKGFLGNGHFKDANEWLEKQYGKEGTISWGAICSQA